jgi:hypothetical protein
LFQGGFVGSSKWFHRAAAGLSPGRYPVCDPADHGISIASPVHGLWGLSFDPGQTVFSAAKLSSPEEVRCPEERRELSPVSPRTLGLPEFSRGAQGRPETSK